MVERFYIDILFQCDQLLNFENEEHRHLKVLRVIESETIEIVNGKGAIAIAQVTKIEKDKTQVVITNVINHPPPSSKIYLGIPLMRPSKLEWVIEKATEIGAFAFFLFTAEKGTQKSLTEHHIDRLSKIQVAALKQSKRLYLPKLEIFPSLKHLPLNDAKCFFGCVQDQTPFLQPDPCKKDVLFISGPESGFSNRELQLLNEKGIGIRLSQHILKAETAPIVASSVFTFLMS